MIFSVYFEKVSTDFRKTISFLQRTARTGNENNVKMGKRKRKEEWGKGKREGGMGERRERLEEGRGQGGNGKFKW